MFYCWVIWCCYWEIPAGASLQPQDSTRQAASCFGPRVPWVESKHIHHTLTCPNPCMLYPQAHVVAPSQVGTPQNQCKRLQEHRGKRTCFHIVKVYNIVSYGIFIKTWMGKRWDTWQRYIYCIMHVKQHTHCWKILSLERLLTAFRIQHTGPWVGPWRKAETCELNKRMQVKHLLSWALKNPMV